MKEAIQKIEGEMEVQFSILRKADIMGRLCAFTDIYYAKRRRYSRLVFDEHYMTAIGKINMLAYVKNILTAQK